MTKINRMFARNPQLAAQLYSMDYTLPETKQDESSKVALPETKQDKRPSKAILINGVPMVDGEEQPGLIVAAYNKRR